MKKINAVIIDDELHSVETLTWKIEKFHPSIHILASFTSSSKGLDFLQQNKIDLLFLDIEMPRLNGFELLAELASPLPFETIFITAYDDFGIKAVKVDALDYLLKPVQNQELNTAIEKYIHQSSSHKGIRTSFTSPPVKIALSTNESIEFVLPEEIVMCSSESNYTMIYLVNKRKKLISKTLKEVESWLQPYGFFRAHNSHLVNLMHIKKFIRAEGGYLLLTEGNSLPVARNRKDDLLKLL